MKKQIDFAIYKWRAGWIRLGPLVLQWKHKVCPALFSERNHYIVFRHVGCYRFALYNEKKLQWFNEKDQH